MLLDSTTTFWANTVTHGPNSRLVSFSAALVWSVAWNEGSTASLKCEANVTIQLLHSDTQCQNTQFDHVNLVSRLQEIQCINLDISGIRQRICRAEQWSSLISWGKKKYEKQSGVSFFNNKILNNNAEKISAVSDKIVNLLIDRSYLPSRSMLQYQPTQEELAGFYDHLQED